MPRRGVGLASNSARTPSCAVLAGGVPVPGVIDVQISTNSYLAANRYRLRVSLSASGYALWASTPLTLEIRFGLDGAWASLMTGQVDRIVVDAACGEILVEGRDLTALLIEARTQETFENQTSSEIATTLAARHGLAPVVTPTTTLVGRNFQNDHARTTLDQHARATTEWDVLIRLAELEGFDVWVDGRTLNFSPVSQNAAPILLTPQDCSSMRLERCTALTAGVSVAVKSWDCRATRTVVQTAHSGGGSSGTAGYMVVRPNMSADAAQTLAQRLARQMAQHGRVVSIDMPGDLVTQPRGTLLIADTGTDFDGAYVITEVERQLSFRHGYQQSLEARLPPWTNSSIT